MEKISNWEKLAFSSWTTLIPILLVIIIIFFAIISGARRGLYGGIIIASFGLLGWIVAVLASPGLSSVLLISLKKNHASAVSEDFERLQPVVFGIAAVIIQLIFCIVGEVVLIIFRKQLNGSIKTRENNHINTAGFKALGGGIATIGLIPCSIMVANIAGLITTNNKVIEANDRAFKFLTFERGEGVSRYTPGLIANAKRTSETKKEKVIDIALKNWFEQFFSAGNYIFNSDDGWYLLDDFEINKNLEFTLKKPVNELIQKRNNAQPKLYEDYVSKDEELKFVYYYDLNYESPKTKVIPLLTDIKKHDFLYNKLNTYLKLEKEEDPEKVWKTINEKIQKYIDLYTINKQSFALFELFTSNLETDKLNKSISLLFYAINQNQDNIKISEKNKFIEVDEKNESKNTIKIKFPKEKKYYYNSLLESIFTIFKKNIDITIKSNYILDLKYLEDKPQELTSIDTKISYIISRIFDRYVELES